MKNTLSSTILGWLALDCFGLHVIVRDGICFLLLWRRCSFVRVNSVLGAWMALPRLGRVPLQVVALTGAFLVTGTSLGQVPLPRPVPPPNPTRQIRTFALPASVPNGFSVAAVGDLIMAHPVAAGRNPGFLGVEKLLRGADVAFGNLEGNLLNPRKLGIWPAPGAGGDYISGPPSLASDIRAMGFNMLSHANNHTTDWGIRGMEATAHALDKAGLVHAGTGPDLAAARAPSYLTIPQGRIALVAMTSTHTAIETAGPEFRGLLGRPGASVLRTTVCHVVTTRQMGSLRSVLDSMPIVKKLHYLHTNPNAKQLDLFGTHFCVGPNSVMGTEPSLIYKMNPYDLDEILRSIREGKEESNFEIVYIHDHEPGNWDKLPANFERTLAHDAIDAGADEYLASGPHRLRGIEIYKGKPIFYSLGDFIFEVGQLRFSNQTRRVHLNAGTTTKYESQQYILKHYHFNAPIWYQSVVAVTIFNRKGDVREVKLYPIDLGYQRNPRTTRGVPRLASPKVAQEILHRLQRLSQPFGTHITIHRNVGVIRVAA